MFKWCVNEESAIRAVCNMGKSDGWFSFTITYTHISRKQRGKVTCTEVLMVNHEVKEVYTTCCHGNNYNYVAMVTTML